MCQGNFVTIADNCCGEWCVKVTHAHHFGKKSFCLRLTRNLDQLLPSTLSSKKKNFSCYLLACQAKRRTCFSLFKVHAIKKKVKQKIQWGFFLTNVDVWQTEWQCRCGDCNFTNFRCNFVFGKFGKTPKWENTWSNYGSIAGHRNLNETERSAIGRYRNINASKICKITVWIGKNHNMRLIYFVQDWNSPVRVYFILFWCFSLATVCLQAYLHKIQYVSVIEWPDITIYRVLW